jgi:outer membrane protein OmpA-like peptidoglycan-associated protein
MNDALRSVAALVLPALLSLLTTACATPQGSVVLLPERDGKATAVVVEQGSQRVPLGQPYAAAHLTSRGPQTYQSSAQEVHAYFAAALAAQPLPPTQFTLYFVEGKDEFTDESKKTIDGILAEIAKRPVPDLVVIGHTDKVGTDSFNDSLSRQRAEVVRNALLARGIAQDRVLAIGRGKREPIVPTADGVAEGRNRRVEIQVR